MVTHSSILAWEIPWTEDATVHRVSKSWTQLKRTNVLVHVCVHGYFYVLIL